jgi:hypothetical protein
MHEDLPGDGIHYYSHIARQHQSVDLPDSEKLESNLPRKRFSDTMSFIEV